MGLFGSKAEEEARHQFIARPDGVKNLVVYKWPDTTIQYLSVVTVQPDEWAFFIKNGKIVGFLRRGMQRLDGASVPFMSELLDRYTGNNVLLSELYFVSSRQFANNKFGGSMGELADPFTGVMVACGAYGEFAFKVTDPGKLVLELLGTKPVSDNGEIITTIRERLMKVTRSVVNAQILEAGWDLLRVTSGAYNRVFEESILRGMGAELQSYGLEVTFLEDFVISVLPQDKHKIQEIYDRRAKMKLAEDDSYRAMAESEVMLGAAEGLKSAGASGAANSAGLGLGVGIGMGLASKMNADGTPRTEQGATAEGGLICTHCSAQLLPGARFCSECGMPASNATTCPTCGETVVRGKFCSACGRPLDPGGVA